MAEAPSLAPAPDASGFVQGLAFANDSAFAPGPDLAYVMAPPPPAPLLTFECGKGQFDCLKTNISDNQILLVMYISMAVGAFFLLVFGTFRSKIGTYTTRLKLPSVWKKPRPLPHGGIHHLWSWLWPVFQTTDAELMETAGMDSLVLSWTNMLGIQIFGPLTILGMAILLPINLQGSRIDQANDPHRLATANYHAATSTFAKLTISNLEKGSQLYWVPFVFVYITVAWVSWLLVKYYQVYVVLRQQYLTGGEELLNEWQSFYLSKHLGPGNSAAAKAFRNNYGTTRMAPVDGGDRATSTSTWLQRMSSAITRPSATLSEGRGPAGGRNIFSEWSDPPGRAVPAGKSAPANPFAVQRVPAAQQPGSPAQVERKDSTAGSIPEGHLGTVYEPRALTEANQASSSGGEGAGVGGSIHANESAFRPHRADAGMRSPSLLEHAAPSLDKWALGDQRSLRRSLSPSSSARDELRRQALSGSSSNQNGQRGICELPSPVAASATSPAFSQASSSAAPGGHFASTSAPEASWALPTEAEYADEHAAGPSSRAGRAPQRAGHTRGQSRSLSPAFLRLGAGRPSPAAYPAEIANLARSLTRPSSLEVSMMERGFSGNAPAVGESCLSPAAAPAKVSQYETNAPCGPHERVHQWWYVNPEDKEQTITGKPSVFCRKTVNADVDGQPGRTVTVNAQQYVVLVMDVPDMAAERRKVLERSRRSWWQSYWFHFVACFQREVLLQKPAVVMPADGAVEDKTNAFRDRTGRAKNSPPSEAAYPANTALSAEPEAAAAAEIYIDAEDDLELSTKPMLTSGKPVRRALGRATSPRHESSSDAGLEAATPVRPALALPAQVGQRQQLAGPPGQAVQMSQWHTRDEPAAAAAANGGNDRASGPGRDLADEQLASPLGGDKQRGSNEEVTLPGNAESGEPDPSTPEGLVKHLFSLLFGDTVTAVTPVYNHKKVDLSLLEWDGLCAKLASAEAAYEESGCKNRPRHRTGCVGLFGADVDSINFWASRVRELEIRIKEEREAALDPATRAPAKSFFVFFNSQMSAAVAAQANLLAEDGHSFCVSEAPGPEEVNWPVLWMTWRERDLREVLVLPLIVGIMLVPIGIFSGAIAQLTLAICTPGTPNVFNKLYSAWYCEGESMGRTIVTSVLPIILLMLWQNLIMPNALYRFAQMEGKSHSLSNLDRRICRLFFYWSVFTIFVGAMLGGSAFSQLQTFLENPQRLLSVIGGALLQTSNFFINYISIQAFAMIPFRMMYPHIGVLVGLFRLCNLCRPKGHRQKVAAWWPHSVRYGREIATTMLIYIMALAYAASSPLILPFTLLYFILSWVFWRYNILYISERCFESGGRIWDTVFQEICWCLFILEFFTGCIFLANAAYIQASVMWVTLTPIIYRFARFCDKRYGAAVRRMPLELAAQTPSTAVNPIVYSPPALRPGAAGWYPEHGKAWESWNAPSYTL